MNDAVWVTWEKQTRNRSMACKLGMPLYEVAVPGNRLRRYAVGVYRTVKIVRRSHCRTIVAQNPSIGLIYLLLLLRPGFGYKLVIDAHYVGVIAPRRNFFFQRLLDFCNKRADLVIVTTQAHLDTVNRLGGKAFVCEDPIPDLSRYSEPEAAGGKVVFFICSFYEDEPYEEVFEAAKILAKDEYKFLVSGNFRKVGLSPSNFPHITFLGYVADSAFYSHLFRSHVIVDLTTYENCLVCGAYEAMAAARPLVTSDTPAMRQYFSPAAVFTVADRISIARAIDFCYKTRSTLKEEIKKWKDARSLENDMKIETLRAMLGL